MSATASARRIFVLSVAAALLALSLVAVQTSFVRAATIGVTTTLDELNTDGDCSLREAVRAANTNLAVDACTAGGAVDIDVINVPAGTYPLSIPGINEDAAATGDLDITGSVTINGAGAGTTIIDGGANDRVFHLLGTATSVAISGVTVRNGSADGGGGIMVDADATLGMTNSAVSGNQGTSAFGGAGGGIYINGTATLTGVTVSGNTAGGGVEANRGGGIFIGGTATLTGVTVSGNTVDQGFGGGIDINGTATLTGVTVSGNTAGEGAGINIGDGGTATLTGGTVSGNTVAAGGVGGGIIISSGGTATLTGVTVSGNSGGNTAGGMYVAGMATLTGVTVSGNTAGQGAGIFILGTATLTGVTVSGNTGGEAGGIFLFGGSLTMRNSTISGNSAAAEGGGLLTQDDARIEFSTITNNTSATGGAGLTAALGTVDLFASIIALNNGDECDTPDGFIESEGSNLSSDATCELDQLSDQPSIANPMLGTLADNGGPTQTHALLAGSAAIDAVQLVGQQLCLGTDQRGITRPQDGDRNGTLVCDIGAYELIPVAASITDVSVTEGNSGTVDAVFTVTLSRPSTGTVSFAYATANGTATVVADYQAATGTVTFAPGDTSETITVRVVGDTIDEPNETFSVNLTAPVGATIADAQGIGTILDDDGAPAPTPAAGQLPDTRTAEGPPDGWGAPGLAIAVLTVSAAALILARRREAIRAR